MLRWPVRVPLGAPVPLTYPHQRGAPPHLLEKQGVPALIPFSRKWELDTTTGVLGVFVATGMPRSTAHGLNPAP